MRDVVMSVVRDSDVCRMLVVVRERCGWREGGMDVFEEARVLLKWYERVC